MTHQFTNHFHSPKDYAAKARASIGSHCLTKDFNQAQWFMMGVPDDRGVKNNYGREGAKEGPRAFREAFYNLSLGSSAPALGSIYDLGDIKLTQDIASSHEQLKNIISQIKSIYTQSKILIIGGGHDIAYAEIAGCLSSSKAAHNHHIINLDAHSDVRPYEANQVISSGTPFYRLITECGILGKHYHPFGLQKASNNAQLVEWMIRQNIAATWLDDMPTDAQQQEIFSQLIAAMNSIPWHLNVDLDAFAVSHAPGVSAQASFGLSPNLLLNLTPYKESLNSLQSLGIYELAPIYDIEHRTARLAAKIAYNVMAACKL
ncbi:MAG TPA: formimidoylglutamase [Oligoflexia bacterium]|nr:formimidoylglutamase [Oligoflexia bacterium]HMR24907.1 formimidoylglutamase [Oligoflexia bacterium]